MSDDDAESGSTPSVDELLAPRFVAHLSEATIEVVRQKRDACNEVELELSYLRRLAQGRLDILRAEIERRVEGGDSSKADLLERLPSILADHAVSPGSGRPPTLLAPDVTNPELTKSLDGAVSPDVLSNLGELDSESLGSIAQRLSDWEAEVSKQRHALHAQIEIVQRELVRRYRDGEANVEQLIP